MAVWSFQDSGKIETLQTNSLPVENFFSIAVNWRIWIILAYTEMEKLMYKNLCFLISYPDHDSTVWETSQFKGI